MIFPAPFLIDVVHGDHDLIGVGIPGAEDDGFLMGSAGFQKELKQVFTHGLYTVVQHEFDFILLGRVLIFDFLGFYLFARIGVNSGSLNNIVPSNLFFIQIHSSANDFTGRQITVILACADGIFIDRLAKVLEIMGGDLFILFPPFRILFAAADNSGGSGQAYMNSVRVIFENNTPFTPGTAVAFVENDMAEIIFRVIIPPEFGLVVFSRYIQGLVSGYQDSGIALGVLRGDGLHIIAEYGMKFGHPLSAEFVPVTNKQGPS